MPTLFGPYRTTPAVIDIYHRISCSQFLTVNACRILFAGDLLAPKSIGGHAGAVPLPPCRGHKEVSFADLALPWVIPVVEALEEIRDDKAVIAVKKQPSCYNLSFTLGVLLVGSIFGRHRQRKFPKDIHGYGE